MSEIQLTDGVYEIEVLLEGGSGRASITSPTELSVVNGEASVKLVWSSPNYDYMEVDKETYFPINTEGNSVFEIPVKDLGKPLSVIADTTAMSVPHEIAYTLTFQENSIKGVNQNEKENASQSLSLVLLGVAMAVVVYRYRLRNKGN